MKVLFVCLGNICRSSMAEGIMKSKIDKYGLEDTIEADSCGFESFHLGEAPDVRAIDVLKKHGIDISNQRQRLFTKEDFDRFDKIYVMDSSNYADVESIARSNVDMDKVDYILNELNRNSNKSLPDPYYGGIDAFENVYSILDKACDAIIEHYITKS